ncbi:spore coat protein E [Salsuginibacillus halophilus]|uniref:Spore coat protein E n=1 Tax=Salsuginibacillus halophilus TaxID=517424 RepID=A0A2P8HYE2_9BACI|nr:outer spore coat protein CotE [Salsuginibacillus halophilus]PSL51268.1 spore coat protein E [Salsuginibacillus halophilus]
MAQQNSPSYREIITKAVCGKGKNYSKATHTLKPGNRPTSILGCWIINHDYDAEKQGDSIDVIGTYDVNVWYSYDKNTKTDVYSETINYKEKVPLTMRDEAIISTDQDVLARTLKQPNALDASIGENEEDIYVDVEREFACELVGETKITVQMHPEQEDDQYKDVKWDEQVADDEFREIEPHFLTHEEDD